MWRIRVFGILCGVLGASALYSADFSTYRGLRFGMSISDVAKGTRSSTDEAKVVHQRPALIQEMEWRRESSASNTINSDPVKQGLLCFYNGGLFRIIVTYDRYKIEGMTEQDMIDGISATYGAARRPRAEIAFHSNYAEVAKVLARWEDSESSYNLVRTGDQSSFALVLYSKRLDALAQAAITEAVRLDVREAPQREIEKQKDQADAARLILEKARSANKPTFRP